MSGPKISVYELNEWGRNIVFEQVRCEQQSVLGAGQIQELLKKVQEAGGKLQETLSLLEMLAQSDPSAVQKRQDLQKQMDELKVQTGRIQAALYADLPQISPKYRVSEEALAQKKSQLAKIKELKQAAKELLKEMDQAAADQSTQRQIYAGNLAHSIAMDLSGSVSFERPFEQEREDENSAERFGKRKAGLQQKLAERLKDPGMPADLCQEIQNAAAALNLIHENAYLNSFESITLKKLMKKIDAFMDEQASLLREFNELSSRYSLLCSMAEEKAAGFACCKEGMAEMKAEINRLEQEIVRAREQEYISDCVDQVMLEMGYDLIGSREVLKKRSGRRFRHELFTFEEGTAVNITYSDQGQISMELGGIAREDKIPDSQESQRLLKDMQTFCQTFSDFEKRLKSKGVILNQRIALLPPLQEYAAIINVSDYELTEGAKISELKSDGRKKKAASKKAMQRTE